MGWGDVPDYKRAAKHETQPDLARRDDTAVGQSSRQGRPIGITRTSEKRATRESGCIDSHKSRALQQIRTDEARTDRPQARHERGAERSRVQKMSVINTNVQYRDSRTSAATNQNESPNSIIQSTRNPDRTLIETTYDAPSSTDINGRSKDA
jgi:hypothetical protein